MHNFLILAIPEKELNGVFDISAAEKYVSEKLKKYTNEKFDYYSIGGRWEGLLIAKKDSNNILLTENGVFEECYNFFNTYDALENNGQRGPYIIENTEYVPANGGLVKDIEWEVFHKFEEYVQFLIFRHIWEHDERLGRIPDAYKFKEDGLYIASPENNEMFLLYKNDESFSDYITRKDLTFAIKFPAPFAFVDYDGYWHDENEIWGKLEADLLKSKNMPEDPEEFVQEEYQKAFFTFLDTLKPTDGVVIVDYHT